MGDAQSAQRERNEDAAAEEESAKVDDAPAEHNTEDKPLIISEINEKADSIIAEANGHCEEEMTAEDKDISGIAEQIKDEETPLESVDINEKETPNEADADKEEEEEPLEIIEMDAKQNDINDSFRRFFSNISLKLSVKRGSVDKDQRATDVSDETNENESNRQEDIKETVKEAECNQDEQSIDLNAQGTYDNDSTTCPTLTDVTSEDIPENIQEKTSETKEEAESDNVATATTSPVAEDEMVQRDAMFEDLNPASTSSPETEEVVSPVKRFFTTGIFSGLRKKKTSIEDETIERELVEMGNETAQTKEKSEDIQQDNEISPLDIEATTVQTENIEKDQTEENLCAASGQMMDEAESPTTATVTANEPENTSSQDKVQDSPLKWLLSGSSFRKTSKKQRGRKSSHEKLAESGEHSDQLKKAAKSAEMPKEESPTQNSETAGEEDGAWASFKKLLTPKKHMKRSSLTNEEAQIAGTVGEAKPSEGDQMSDNSTEEGKKRKDSSVSWEAVLCGSGKKSRSRKTSDSEDETPETEDVNKKETSPLESSSEADERAISPKQAGSPSEGEGGSTWKSFKKLVTPKRKAKDEEESKDNIQSDSEGTQDEPSFSIKKFLPGRKKKKTAENQDQVSSDEAEKGVASGDEDSETPAVVPLSEFDTTETEVHIETQADVESPVPKEADYELEQDLLDQIAKPVLPSDSLPTDTTEIQANGDNLKHEPPAAPASHEEAEDLTESFSNHHQLSDIPEEGIITDTIATQASIAEEAARDDTIMEDLIEITSEAITAPEPIDETEMISAVSQLSESSNTSGNITPVPVEYDIRHTEALLEQVVETISISPEAEPVCSEEINSERILETFVKRESAILETHRRSDATSIVTSLNADEMDIIEHSATAHAESISEINESLSRDIVSEAPTEEFVTAEIAVDEGHEVSIKKPAYTGESQPLVERQCEINEAASMETLPEVESIVADEGCLVGTHQDEKEPLEIDSQEAESAAITAEESEDGTAGQEEQTPTHKEEQILPHITDQVKVDNKDQPQVEEEELQALQAVQDATSGSEEGSDQLLEKVVLSEDCTAEGTTANEPKEETMALTEYNVEAKTEKVQADAAQPDHSEEPELLEDVQTAAMNVDVGIDQLLEKEAITEDSPSEETVTHKPNKASEFLTQYTDAEMKDKMQVDAQTEHFGENVLEAVQTKLDSKEDSSQLLEKEVTIEDTTGEETVTDKPEEETEPIIELDVKAEMENQILGDGVQIEHAEIQNVLESAPTEETGPFNEYDVETENKMTNAPQNEPTEEIQVLEVVQITTLNLEEVSGQLLEKEVTLGDIQAQETVTDKPNEETQPLTECDVQEETENRLQTDDAQTEQVLEAAQKATLDLEDNSGQLAKQVISEDSAAGESITDESKEETLPLTEYDIAAETENKFQEDAAQTLNNKEPQVLEAAQTATLDLEDNSGQLLAKQVISEDSAAGESITDESKEDTQPLTEYDIAAETGNKFQEDAAQTLHTKEPQVLEAAQTAKLNLEKDGGGQLLREKVTSEDIQAQETVTNKPKEQTQPLTEHDVEEGTENRLQTHAAQTTQVGKPEVVQTATLDFEDSGQLLPKEVISEDIPAEETVKTEPLTEYNVAAEAENKLQTDTAQMEHTGEPEVLEAVETDTLVVEEGNLQTSNESEVPQAIPAAEMFDTDQATENLSEVSSKPDDKDLKRDAPNIDQVAEIIGAVSVQSLRKEFLAQNTEAVIDEAKEETEPLTEGSELAVAIESEHVQDHAVVEDVILAQSAEDVTGHTQQPEVSPSNVNDTETSTETEVESSMAAQAVTESAEGGSANVLKVNKDQKTESTPHNAQVSQEDHVHEVVDEVQTVTAVCVSSVDDEASCVQVREKPVFSKVSPAALLENAKFTHERAHAQHLGTVQCNIEEEEKGVIPGFEFKHAAVEHAIIAQVTTCHLKDVAAAIPDVLIETKSDCREPLIESVVSQLDCKETTETATLLVKKYVTVTEEDSSVVLMNVPLVEFRDNCQIQVQVVNVDIKSAEKTVDTALEVGITEAKEVIDVCQESVEEIDQSESVILEQEVIKQTDTVIETCKTAETELSEVEDQNVVEDTTVGESQEDVTAVASDESAAEEQMFKDLVQTSDIPGEVDLDKEEEPKTEVEMPKVDVTTEEVRLLSDLKKINEETKITQITESQIVTPNAGLVVPQNTGIISSIGNVESPSSLSLEFKLNIQFGRVKEPASPPPTTERTEPMKKTEVSEVGVQAVEPEEQPEKKQKTTELVDVTVQGTEIAETEAANVEQTEMSTITNQPQLIDVSMQAVKTDEPAEQLKPTERGTANVQVKETTETIIKNEKREVSLSPAGPAEVCEQETKAEEADQDVWMDAEEGVDNLEETEKSLHETDEPPEHQQESNQEEMSVPEPDFDRTATSMVKEEENQQTLEQRGTFEIESEGEDFAVALEDSATATASTAIMEWD